MIESNWRSNSGYPAQSKGGGRTGSTVQLYLIIIQTSVARISNPVKGRGRN